MKGEAVLLGNNEVEGLEGGVDSTLLRRKTVQDDNVKSVNVSV